MKIFYHNDADGRCAGAIAYRSPMCQKQADLIEMEYSKRVPVETIGEDELIVIQSGHVHRTEKKSFRKLKTL